MAAIKWWSYSVTDWHHIGHGPVQGALGRGQSGRDCPAASGNVVWDFGRSRMALPVGGCVKSQQAEGPGMLSLFIVYWRCIVEGFRSVGGTVCGEAPRGQLFVLLCVSVFLSCWLILDVCFNK